MSCRHICSAHAALVEQKAPPKSSLMSACSRITRAEPCTSWCNSSERTTVRVDVASNALPGWLCPRQAQWRFRTIRTETSQAAAAMSVHSFAHNNTHDTYLNGLLVLPLHRMCHSQLAVSRMAAVQANACGLTLAGWLPPRTQACSSSTGKLAAHPVKSPDYRARVCRCTFQPSAAGLQRHDQIRNLCTAARLHGASPDPATAMH